MNITRSALSLIVTLFVWASLGTAAVHAQDASASHLAAAKRAIVATRSTNRLDAILPQMAQQAKAELIRNRPDKEAEITALVDEAAISLAGRRGDLEGEIVQIFSRIFSEDELNAIADFYETDAGKKFLSETPVMLREIDRASRVWTNGVQRDLATAVREKMTAAGLQ
ncbi:DUF2059 domain-containing protein [Salaquimonas pukyongi]|uniref:DUF2059 domain-containing protein n=1 Tax=Salaquimonas pukyongi TaxID=2712698 RepID=UPI00096B9813|nr:DUF2059 domain-containing protein [Salaquimonas pukyongi]